MNHGLLSASDEVLSFCGRLVKHSSQASSVMQHEKIVSGISLKISMNSGRIRPRIANQELCTQIDQPSRKLSVCRRVKPLFLGYEFRVNLME